MARDHRLPTISSPIARDLRAFTDELRRILTNPDGWRGWDGSGLPAITSQQPRDVIQFTDRVREVMNEPTPPGCIPPNEEAQYGREWQHPRDTLPRLTSDIPEDLRAFFERVREMMLRDPVPLCPDEKTCSGDEGVWVTSTLYPIEINEQLRAAPSGMWGNQVAAQIESFAPQARLISGLVELMSVPAELDALWDSFAPQARLTGGKLDGQLAPMPHDALVLTPRIVEARFYNRLWARDQVERLSLYATVHGDLEAPLSVTFSPVEGAEPAVLCESNYVKLPEDLSESAISIDAGDYRIRHDHLWGSWRTTSATVVGGDMVQVRVAAPDQYETSTTITLTIDSVSGAFTVTTRAEVVE